MFRTSIHLVTVRGIPVGVHYTWLIIFALITMGLRAYFVATYPHWSDATALTTAALTSLLFFVCIVLHELGHSLVAQRYGIPILGITLFIFGGVAQTGREAEQPAQEFWVAVAGPAVSLLLAGVFYALSAAAAGGSPLAAGLGWLASINLIIALFNLLPGFPLDGGRVLRAVVWRITGNQSSGMRWATYSGIGFAYFLIGVGVISMLRTGNLLNGLWFIALGIFLLSATEASARSFSMSRLLHGISVKDVMQSALPEVEAGTSVQAWLDELVVPQARRAHLVVRDEQILGLVTLSDAGKVDRSDWKATEVTQIMTPRSRLKIIAPDTPVEQILQTMEGENINQMPVVEGERIVGWLDRERLLRMIRLLGETRGERR